MSDKPCAVEGCAEPHYGLGFCKSHWGKFRRHGTPTPEPRERVSAASSAEKARRRKQRYRARHPERIAERARSYQQANPERVHAYGRKHNLARFGLTIDQYDAMLYAQLELCAICGKAESNVVKGRLSRLRVDHDHATGKVRALLCNTCNLHLGLLLEDEAWTAAALNYLKNHGKEIA